MKTLIVVLVLLVAGVVGVGFYEGWFKLSTESVDHKSNLTLTVDPDKIKEDEKKAAEKVHGLTEKVKDKTGDGAGEVKEQERKP